MIDDAAMRSLLELSRLEVPVEEVKELEGQLDEILAYFERLSRIDTSSVDVDLGTERAIEETRRDESAPGLDRGAIEVFSKTFEQGFFVVPLILGDTDE